MSVSFLLADEDAAVIWRGPRKNGMIKQFLTETEWDSDGLDYLIVDTPPGTSDEHISTVQLLQAAGGASGALVVTTPEEVSMSDVRKELNFCVKTKIEVVGVVENMSSYQTKVKNLKFLRHMSARERDLCEDTEEGGGDETSRILALLRERCPEVLDMVASAEVFPRSGSGPKGMANKFGVPYLGELPLDPNLLKSCEDGVCFVEAYGDSAGAGPMSALADRIVQALPVEEEEEIGEGDGEDEENNMEVAQ